MTAIYDSPFLIALGWTIASSLWQAALLWLIYQVVNSGGNKVSPALKHSVAVSFLFISFVWFGITFVQNYNEVAALKQSLSGIADTNITLTQALFNITVTEGYAGNRITTVINSFLPYLSAAYLIVLLILLVKLIRAYVYSIQLKTQGLIALDEQWLRFVNTYALSIGINRKVKVFLSEKIDVPATLDFFKPIILLPVATFNHLTIPQVESVLLHELAHIRRNDYLINIIASVIETILFFNPFVHLLTQSLKKEREHCCDDLVLRYKFDPHSYASALLSLEKMRIGIQPLAVAATGQSNQLLGRVKRIMNVKNTNFNYGQKLTALMVTALILLSLAWLSPSSDQSINNPQIAARHIEQKAAEINTAPVPSSLSVTVNTVTEEKKTVQIAGNNHVNTNHIDVDSIVSDIHEPSTIAPPPTPPSAPIPPHFPAMPDGVDAITGSGSIIIPHYPAEFSEQYKQFSIAAPDRIDFSIDNENWEKIQQDLADTHVTALNALDKNLHFIIADNPKKLNNLFENNQKRLIAEKYLEQLLQKKLSNKDIMLNQQRLLTEQKLQLAKTPKTKAQVDSVRTKTIKRKAVQKAIWINNHLLPEKVNKALEKLHLSTEAAPTISYTINVDMDTDTLYQNSNKIFTVSYITTTTETRDFSFDYQSNRVNTNPRAQKAVKTLTICSDDKSRVMVIGFQ